MHPTPAAAPVDTDSDLPDRFLAALDGAGMLLMASVGHRTGLFDALSGARPMTAAELAQRSGTHERYVREWLGAMVAARIVELDGPSAKYHLPAEHAAWLTRAGANGNLAATAQWVAVLGAIEDGIVDCFARGGGLPYGAYRRFHEVMAEESAQTVVAALDSHLLPLDPVLVPRLERGIDVLDVGCGEGRALLHLAKRFPRSRFLGLDLCAETVAAARGEARRAGIDNTRFEQQDVSELAEERRFGLITAFDAIHDQAQPALVLARIEAALADDGVFLMQEIRAHSAHEHNVGAPLAAFVYTISCMHCMSVSLSQGGAGLGAAWGRELCAEMLREAGLGNFVRHELEHDPMNDYYVVRRS